MNQPDPSPKPPGAQTAEQGKKEESPKVPSIRLWSAALHVVALLALFGFIVKIAQEQFLGISFIQWGPAELSTASGRWLVDTVLVTSQWCILHWAWAALWAASVLVFIAISLEFPTDSVVFRVFRCLAVITVFVALTTVFIRVQLPITTIQGWLTTELSSRFPSDEVKVDPIDKSPTAPAAQRVPLTEKFFQEKQHFFNREIFLSHSAGLAACLAKSNKGLPNAILTAASNPGEWGDVASTAEEQLQGFYVVQVILCLGGWVVFYLQKPASAGSRIENTIDILALVVSFVLLPLCTLMVPYSYGKLISPTQFARVSVQFNANDADQNLQHFLIERSDSETTLLSINATVPKAEVLRSDEIFAMDIFDKVDVLESWNDTCWFTPVPPPA